MKNQKKLEVLLKVIKRIYDKNLGMQEMIDASMKDVSADEGISRNRYFFCCCYRYHNGYSGKKVWTRVLGR